MVGPVGWCVGWKAGAKRVELRCEVQLPHGCQPATALAPNPTRQVLQPSPRSCMLRGPGRRQRWVHPGGRGWVRSPLEHPPAGLGVQHDRGLRLHGCTRQAVAQRHHAGVERAGLQQVVRDEEASPRADGHPAGARARRVEVLGAGGERPLEQQQRLSGGLHHPLRTLQSRRWGRPPAIRWPGPQVLARSQRLPRRPPPAPPRCPQQRTPLFGGRPARPTEQTSGRDGLLQSGAARSCDAICELAGDSP